MHIEKLLKILACPCCLGSLETVDENGKITGFLCQKCKVVYPVREDIPIMLKEEAIPFQQWQQGRRYGQ